MGKRLNKDSLQSMPVHIRQPAYASATVGIGIVHLGAGAFFKAHQAVYTDEALALEGGDWGICAASLNSTTAKDTLAPQDGLYTLKTLDDPPRYRVIGAIREVLAGVADRSKVIARIAEPDIHIVTLTITEKGYCLKADGTLDLQHRGIKYDLESDGLPATAIGVLAAGLAQRFAVGGAPITLISCDNISQNGARLRNALLDYTRLSDAALADWIDAYVACPCTMVDSITPASDALLVRSVASATGLEDAAPVHREPFSDWVIENFEGPRPAWGAVGAIFTDDVAPYEEAKLRLVNAPHSALTYLGLLTGHETVAETMADKAFASYFHRLSVCELIPSLGTSALRDLYHYSNQIGARFANRSIHHRLEQIAHDGSVKLPQRLLPPLQINHLAGRSVSHICLAIAAWMRFVMQRARAGIEIVDSLADKLCALATQKTGEEVHDVVRLLGLRDIFPEWMAADQQLITSLKTTYDRLSLNGVHSALDMAERARVS